MHGGTKRMLTFLVLYAVIIYVLWETLDALRSTEKRTRMVALVFWFLAGFAVGAYWMYKHMTCESCQHKWRGFVRRTALRYVE